MQIKIDQKLMKAMFQSPRSGKFVSNTMMATVAKSGKDGCFNPLDRGNLYQIYFDVQVDREGLEGFNPLDRGNLYLIRCSFCCWRN